MMKSRLIKLLIFIPVLLILACLALFYWIYFQELRDPSISHPGWLED